jgi:hypothetical protein
MYDVKLISLPHHRHERAERVVQKHNPGLDHGARLALLAKLTVGPQNVARYEEKASAEHVAAEYRLLGGVVEIVAAGGEAV